jgi:hypothetical protein
VTPRKNPAAGEPTRHLHGVLVLREMARPLKTTSHTAASPIVSRLLRFVAPTSCVKVVVFTSSALIH